MKYKVVRESEIWKLILAITAAIISIYFIIFLWIRKLIDFSDIMIFGCCFFIATIYFVHSFWLRLRKKRFYKYGTKYQGEIVGADYWANLTGIDDYFLYIEFTVNGVKKTTKTRAYEGDPNHILESRYCSIYEYKGKYLEGDFRTLDKEDYKRVKIIPTRKIKVREMIIR